MGGRGLVLLWQVGVGLGRQGGLVVEVVEGRAGRVQEEVLLVQEEVLVLLVVLEEEVQPLPPWCRCHAPFQDLQLRRAVADGLVGRVLVLVLVLVLLVGGPGLAAGEGVQGAAGGGVGGGGAKAAVAERGDPRAGRQGGATATQDAGRTGG